MKNLIYPAFFLHKVLNHASRGVLKRCWTKNLLLLIVIFPVIILLSSVFAQKSLAIINCKDAKAQVAGGNPMCVALSNYDLEFCSSKNAVQCVTDTGVIQCVWNYCSSDPTPAPTSTPTPTPTTAPVPPAASLKWTVIASSCSAPTPSYFEQCIIDGYDETECNAKYPLSVPTPTLTLSQANACLQTCRGTDFSEEQRILCDGECGITPLLSTSTSTKQQAFLSCVDNCNLDWQEGQPPCEQQCVSAAPTSTPTPTPTSADEVGNQECFVHVWTPTDNIPTNTNCMGARNAGYDSACGAYNSSDIGKCIPYQTTGSQMVASCNACSSQPEAAVSTATPTPTPPSVIIAITLIVQDVPDKDLTANISAELSLRNPTTNALINGAPAGKPSFAKTAHASGRRYSASAISFTTSNLTSDAKYLIVARNGTMIAKSLFTFSGQTTTLIQAPAATLVFGDINNDNDININDYNTLRPCYKKSIVVNPACASSDIDNNGTVDQIDYNTWLRGFATWSKEGK